MLDKVISGAQTGADLGGLIAAKFHGIDTGGWMTQGFRTQNGPKPEYVQKFGIKQHCSASYKDRTWENAADSDGTIRIACYFGSSGEKCTLNGIKAYGKPHIDIQIDKAIPLILKTQVSDVCNWIVDNDISILNVAGNSHKTWEGMQHYTTTFLSLVFFELGHTRHFFPKEFI